MVFIAWILGFVEVTWIFYSLVFALTLFSILSLPANLTPLSHTHRSQAELEGNPFAAVFFSLVAYAAALYHFDISLGSWTHWVVLLVTYLVIGVLWATTKWWFFCGNVRDEVKDKVERFTLTVEDEVSQDEVDRSFMNYINNDTRLCKYKSFPYMHENSTPWKREEIIDALVPLVSEHKGVVLTWLFCWPMSVLKWALADMLRDLYNAVFSAIKGAFQKIAASRFTDI